jgi:hypothetical protein
MNINGVTALTLQSLEQLAKEWEANYRPEDIRLNIDQLEILLGANRTVHRGELRAEVLQAEAPTFCLFYRAVMLRDIEEPIPNGNET